MNAKADADTHRLASPAALKRIDRWRLDSATFPLVTEVPTRFADLDTLGHINNVAAFALLQEGRTAFNRATRLHMVSETQRTMVAGTTVEYASEATYPAPLEIHTGLIGVGRTSFTFGQIALQHGRPVLYAQTTLVMIDKQGPMPIPDQLRAEYEKFLI